MPKDGERPLNPEEREFLHGLYQNHYRALFDYACRLGIGREAAEDYVHDAFITAIRHIGELRTAENPRRYLNQALKNVIGYRLRSLRYAVNRQKKLQAGMDQARGEPHTDEIPAETLYRGAVGDAELELLIRFYLEGWSQKELAEEMGVSENACKQRIKRAKAHLRNALEGDKPPGADGPTDAGSGLTGRRPGQK